MLGGLPRPGGGMTPGSTRPGRCSRARVRHSDPPPRPRGLVQSWGLLPRGKLQGRPTCPPSSPPLDQQRPVVAQRDCSASQLMGCHSEFPGEKQGHRTVTHLRKGRLGHSAHSVLPGSAGWPGCSPRGHSDQPKPEGGLVFTACLEMPWLK